MQFGQQPIAPTKSGALKWVLILLAVLLAIVAAAGAASYLLSDPDSTEATDVKVGDCLADIPDSSRVLTVRTVTCDQPHKGEVFAVLPLPEGDFPGDTTVLKYTDRCAPALARQAPQATNDPDLTLFVLYPTADSWQRGDRTVTCIATSEEPRSGKMQ